MEMRIIILTSRQLLMRSRRDGVAVILLENSGKVQKLQLLHHCGSDKLGQAF